MICLLFVSVLGWPHGLERRAGTGTAGPRHGRAAGQPVRSSGTSTSSRTPRWTRPPTRTPATGRCRPSSTATARAASSRQRQPGPRVLRQPQPVPRLRARLHLLLRAADPRVPRLRAGLDFETRIMVKEDAPELLREALRVAALEPQVRGALRRHRLLPADRAHAAAHAPLPRGAAPSSAIRSASSPRTRWSRATSICSPSSRRIGARTSRLSITTLDADARRRARAARRRPPSAASTRSRASPRPACRSA